jgi:hypothetical protein
VWDLDLHSTSSPLWLWIQVEVNRRWFGRRRPEYTVTVNAGADCAFVLLLVMIMERQDQRNERAAAANVAAAAPPAVGGF